MDKSILKDLLNALYELREVERNGAEPGVNAQLDEAIDHLEKCLEEKKFSQASLLRALALLGDALLKLPSIKALIDLLLP